MNKNLLLLLMLFVGFAGFAQNTQSFSKSSLIIDGNPRDITSVSGGLGTFDCKTTIGFETVVQQSGTCNVSSASMAFRVYKIGETPGDFIAISAPFASETADGSCKKRVFKNDDIKSVLLQNLENGDYNLDFYFQSNGEGCDIINLQSVTYSTTFTYAKEPTIVFQPIDLISCTGGDAFFKTSATGVGSLTYRWQMSDNGGAFTNLSVTSKYKGVTTNNLRIDGVGATDRLDQFRCVISDANGCSINTDAAKTEVNRFGSISIPGTTICEGINTEFLANVTFGDTISAQWENQLFGSGSYNNVIENENFKGVNSPILQITDFPKNYRRYRLNGIFKSTIMGDDGSELQSTCSAVSSARTFTINPRPEKPTAISDTARCGIGTIELIAPLDTTGYRWYADTTSAAVATTEIFLPNLTQTQDLFFSYLNAESCESHRTKFTATVNPIPSITLGAIADICFGDEAVDLPFTDLMNGDSYSISSTDANVIDVSIPTSPIKLELPGTLPAGTYNFILKLKNSTTECESEDIPFTVRVKAATVIASQPILQEVCEGEPATFGVLATGEGTLNYRWFKGTELISDENTATLSFAAVTVLNQGLYSCKITGECGEVTSDEVDLTVNLLTIISQQPQNTTVCEGNSATFTVNATGAGTLSYQWKKNGNNIGTNSNSLFLDELQNADNNAQISCEISSSECVTLSTHSATLTVIPLPAAPSVTSPTGFCKNATASALTAIPVNENILLWWGNDATGGVISAGAPTPVTTDVGSTNYYVSQKDINDCESTRAKIEVVISEPVFVEISPSQATICAVGELDKSAILQAFPSGGNGTFTYIWRNSGGILSGETGSSITVNSPESYSVQAISAFCSATEIQEITAIFPELSVAPSATDLSICFQETATLNASSEFSGGGFRWYDVANGTTALSSGNPFIFNNLTESRTVYVAYQKTAGITTCETPRTAVNITVAAQLNIASPPQNVTKCDGNTANFSATIPNAISYQWQRKLPNGDFENISGETSDALRISSIGNSSNPHLTKYRLVASSGTCSVTTDEVTLFVNSKDENLDSQTACVGSNVTFSVPATTGIIQSYEWQKRTGSSGSFDEIIGETSESLLIENVSLAEDNTFYRCRLVFDNGDGSTCVITTDDGRLTVKEFSLSLSKTDVKCFGETTGSIIVTALGSSGYEYQISGGGFQTSNIFEGLTAGTFTVNVKDENGCTATENIEISEPIKLTLTANSSTLTCNGDNDGIILATTAGGTGPYEYKLDDGSFSTANTFENLTAGNYTVMVRDGNGCEASERVSIEESAPIIVSDIVTTPASCGATTGSISFNASGGNGGLNFKLDESQFQTNALFINLASGTYLITVQDATNCVLTQSVTVGGDVTPVVTTEPQNATKCQGNTVNFSATIPNATSYQWQRKLPNGDFENISGETSDALRISSIGNSSNPHLTKYRLVASSGTCSVTTDEVTLFVNSKDANLDSQTACLGSDVTFSVPETTGIIQSYEWQKRTGSSGAFDKIIGANSRDLVLSNVSLAEDNTFYRCRLVFDNGDGSTCVITTDDGRLTVKGISVSLTKTDVKCFGETTGSIIVTASGSSGYEYQINGGGFQTSNTFEDLAAGAFTVNVKDENGCTATENAIITEPSAISISNLTTTPAACIGAIGSISFTVSGGTGASKFKLNDGDFQSSSTFSNLSGGTYSLTIEDENGCTFTQSEVTVGGKAVPVITVQPTDLTNCEGNTVTFEVTASNVTNYQWQQQLPNGIFTNIDGENTNELRLTNVGNSTSPHLSKYRVLLQNDGCDIISDVATLNVNSVLGNTENKTLCVGSDYTLDLSSYTITGTVSAYQWQYRNGTSGSWIDLTSGASNSLILSNLQDANSGYYRCRITFENSSGTCIEYNETGNGLKVDVGEPNNVVISADKTIVCDGESATLTASSCNGNLLWSTGETTTSILVTAASSYTATCRVDNCESEVSVPITITPAVSPIPPIITSDINEVCSIQKANLSATCVIGSIKWSTGESTAIIQVGAGTYTATCENICGASSKEITITQKDAPNAPVITATKTFICTGETATLTATGCNGTLMWSTGQTTTSIVVIQPDQPEIFSAACYNECGTSLSSESITINNALPTGGTIEATAAINCAGYNPPTIANSVSPVGENLAIQWQQRSTSGDWVDIDGASSLTYNPNALSDTTLYRRKVSNTCGDAFSNVDTIYIAPDPSVLITSAKALVCSNETFTLNAVVTGGSGNCPILWQRNERSAAAGSSFWEDISGTTETLTINNLSNTSSENVAVYYRVVVDCQPTSCNKATADAFEITVQPSFEFALNFTDSTICEGNSLEITATGCGGMLSWSSGESTASVTVSPAASTNYTATCSNSCGSSSQSATITVLPGGVPLPENQTVSGVVTPATLTFAASGTNLKWYAAETGGTASATPPSFTEIGTYTVWVSQSDGRCESNRLKITAAVYSPLALLSQSIDQYDCKGNSVTLFVEAVGAGNLRYQWQRKRPEEDVFTNLTENDGVSFSYGPVMRVSGVGNANNPHLSQYRCFVTDSLGSVYSNRTTLFVNSLAGTFSNVGACIGTDYEEDIAVKFVITGEVSKYQWQTRSGTSGPWDDMIDTDRISGTNTSRLKISPLEYTDGRYYRCGVTFNTGSPSCTENTDPSRLDVSGYPNAPEGSTVEYCQFDRARRLAYDTRSSNDVLWYSAENQLVGETRAPTPETSEAGEFPVFFTEATPQGCESPKVKMNVIIHPEPAPPINTTPLFVKEGTLLEFTAEGENLKWFTSRTGRTHTSATPTYADPKLYKHYVSQTSAFGCESGRTYIEAEIREALKFTRLPEFQADCEGNSVTFDAAAESFSNVTFQWEFKSPNAEDFQKILGETERRLTIRDVGEGNNLDGTLYRCLIKDAEDSLYSSPVPLIVNKVIGEIPDVAVCAGQQIVLDSTQIKATGIIERFEWQRQLGRSWETIDSTSNWLNLGVADSSKTADYRLKVVFKVNDRLTCNRYSPEAKVVVNAVPAAPVTTDYAVCKFTEQRLKIEPKERGNQVLWFSSLTDSLGKVEPPKNLSATSGKQTFFVAERSGKGCESNRTPLNFTTLPSPQKPLTDSLLSVCQFSSTVYLTAVSQNSLLWSVETTDDFTEEIPAISTQFFGSQRYFVAAIDSNGCLSENQRIMVSVAPCLMTAAEVNPESCNEIIRENVNGNAWVNFYNTAGKLFGAINPNGQNLGTVTLNFQLANANFQTPEGTVLFPRYFSLKSSVSEEFERPVSVRLFSPKNENSSLISAQDWFLIHYEGINEDCDPLNNDNFANGRSKVIDGNIEVADLTSEIDFFEFSTASFSEFGLTNNPFARIETEAIVRGNQVNISLNIAEEIRPLNYFIERSIDGENWFAWRQISLEDSKQLVDIQPFGGTSYYRTVYQDLDGTLKYFAPVSANFGIAEPICTVFPNPVIENQSLNLYIRNLEPVTFEFFDLMLRKWSVAARRTEPNNYELTLSSSLVQGTYFIRAIDAEEKSCVVKIVKK